VDETVEVPKRAARPVGLLLVALRWYVLCVRRRDANTLTEGVVMKSRAAVLREVGADWSVEEIEITDPQEGEILVKTLAAGMCHSDEHAHDGTMPVPLPLIGGHEGAGEVIALGPGVTGFEVGDHISCSFIPSCGKCRWCASGQQNLCDLGMHLMAPGMIGGGFRHYDADGNPLTPLLKLGTFAEHMVLSVDSAIKIQKDVPAGPAALVSCGVTTGFGSAVNRAGVRAGDTVVIVGCGGLGTAAIQGAKIAGAKNVVAVDPSEFKRESAQQFGATHSAPSMAEAMEMVGAMTEGVMADSVILTPSVLTGDLIAPAQFLTRKGGTIVATAVAPAMQMDVQLNLFELAMMNKELKGCLFGSTSPRSEIPHLLSMYQAGQLKLDEMITSTYTLDQVNEGYADMMDNKNIRGVIVFD
jgi:NDMA-dependent alcohol dehydrogenase